MLNDEIADLWKYAVSAGTAKSYQSAFHTFQNFSTLANVTSHHSKFPPLSEGLLVKFVTYCANLLHLKFTTIKLYLSAIRFNYIRAGHVCSFENMHSLKYILQAIKRKQSIQTPQKRFPITIDILRNLCQLLNKGVFSPFTDTMLKSACLLAFYGFLRCGEFTVKNTTLHQENILCIKDITFSPCNTKLSLKLNASKTDPFRKGVNIQIFENQVLFPVSAVSQYVKLRYELGANQSSPLFVDADKSVLSRDHFLTYLHHLLARLGLDTTKFNGHSFRIGAATSAAASGVQDHVIQTLGRWSSTCYTKYIRPQDKSLQMAQKQMSQ